MNQEIPGEFFIPPDADFLSSCDQRRLEIRTSHHRDIEGFTYNENTGLYDKEDGAIRQLYTICEAYMDSSEMAMVRSAVALSSVAHARQYRDSGEPYTMHVLHVASNIASRHKLDGITIAAALLHDAIEDTTEKSIVQVTAPVIASNIHQTVAETVLALSKARGNYYRPEMVRELVRLNAVLSLVDNPRVAIIKIYDRLHNLQTLSRKRGRVSRINKITETQHIYIPLARQMGMYQEAAILDMLCLENDDREDQIRLAQIRQEHKDIRHRKNLTHEVQTIFSDLHVYSLTYRFFPGSAAAMYRNKDGLFHINVDISIPGNYRDGTWGERAWLLMSRLLWNTQTYTNKGVPSLSEFQTAIESNQSDVLSFWMIRIADGMRFHMHIYPQDVYQREPIPLTYLYNQQAASAAEGTKGFALYSLAREKQSNLATRLKQVVIDLGTGESADRLLIDLAARIPEGMMSLIGEDEEGVRLPWRIREGSTALDFAKSIDPSHWPMAEQVTVNGEVVPFSTVLNQGDNVHVRFGALESYDPVWIHCFGTDGEGPEIVREKIEELLRENVKERRSIFQRIVSEGKTQLNRYLPEEERPLRFGLMQPNVKQKVVAALAVVARRAHRVGIARIINELEPSDTNRGKERQFYFGVGMGLVPPRQVKEIMQRVRIYNKNVGVVEVTFGESSRSQGRMLLDITDKLGLNILDITTDNENSMIRLFLRPSDEKRRKKILHSIRSNKELHGLGFISVAWRKTGEGRFYSIAPTPDFPLS